MLIASPAPGTCSLVLGIFNIFHALLLRFVQLMVQCQLKKQISVIIIISSQSFQLVFYPLRLTVASLVICLYRRYSSSHFPCHSADHADSLCHVVRCSLAHRDVWNWWCCSLFSTTQNKKPSNPTALFRFLESSNVYVKLPSLLEA